MAIEFQKLTNGNVIISENGVRQRFSANSELKQSGSTIEIVSEKRRIEFTHDEVDSPVTADLDELFDVLNADFFFHALIKFDNTGTNLNALTVQDAIAEIDTRNTDMNEPSGFIRKSPLTTGKIEFSPDGTIIHGIDHTGTYYTNSSGNFGNDTPFQTDAAARQAAIMPADGESDYLIYIAGRKYAIADIQVVTLAETSGLHYIYHNALAELVSSVSQSSTYFSCEPITIYIYYNAEVAQFLVFADERHGIEMDGMTHRYLHIYHHGAKYGEGMVLSGLISGQRTFTSISLGRMADEDIEITVPLKYDTPFYYIQGASLWRATAASNQLGHAPLGVGQPIQYNRLLAGTYSLVNVTGNDVIAMFVFATNNALAPYIRIIGQVLYTDLNAARVGVITEVNALNESGLPSLEFIAIAAYLINSTGQLQTLPNGRLFMDLRRPSNYICDVQ